MNTYICTAKCTFGAPPRFYSVGEKILIDGDCPRNFAPAAGSPAPAAAKEPDTLSAFAQKVPDPVVIEEACTVEELAEKLKIDVEIVKQLAGKVRKNQPMSPTEIGSVKAALAKAGKLTQPGE